MSNIRSTPQMGDENEVGFAHKGEKLLYLGKSTEGNQVVWHYIQNGEDLKGWISNEVVEEMEE